MPLVNTSLPNLIQGVSQQPDGSRYAGQCTEQENALSSVLEGLVKRPPAEFLGKLFDYTGSTEGDALDKAFIRFIERDDQEKYVVIISSDTLRIFRIPNSSTSQAVEATITFDGTTYPTGVPLSSVPYLASSFSNQDINSLTIGDTTILVNRTKTVAKGASQTPERPKKAVVFVKQVDFEKKYRVSIDDNGTGATGEYTTLDNTDAAHTKSSLIIDDLDSDIGARAKALDPAHLGLHLAFDNARIKIEDDLSGDGLGIVYKEVNSISDLPIYCIEGMIVKVKGDAELNEDDYYVKFEVNEGENTSDTWFSTTSTHGNGSWVETVAPSEPSTLDYVLDEITVNVPMILRNTAPNTFELEAMEFTARGAGDDSTNPFPSFVGANIENAFLFKGRLGFLSQDAVIFSESGFGPLNGDKQTFNFFRTTVTTLLDSDPIDVRVSNKSVTNLRSAQPLQEDLLIFSDVAQFKLSGADILTPKTVSITQVTSYESQTSVEPLPLGSNLYFPFTRGAASGLREYNVNPTTASYDAFDTTQHVPNYVPNGVTSCTGVDSENIIALSTGSVDEGPVLGADDEVVVIDPSNTYVSIQIDGYIPWLIGTSIPSLSNYGDQYSSPNRDDQLVSLYDEYEVLKPQYTEEIKNAFLPLFNNNEDLCNKNVVIRWTATQVNQALGAVGEGGNNGWADPNINYNGTSGLFSVDQDDPGNRLLDIVIGDRATPYFEWFTSSIDGDLLDSHIVALKGRLDANPLHRSIVMAVDPVQPYIDDGDELSQILDLLINGDWPTFDINDFSQAAFLRRIPRGESESYYANLLKNTLNSLGVLF